MPVAEHYIICTKAQLILLHDIY